MNKLHVKSTVLTIICIALLTAFVSEIKIIPFENAPFRFGLGSIIFFLGVLITTVPVIWAGVITSFTVVLFRTIISVIYFQTAFIQSFIEYLPAAAFYIIFALCLRFIAVEKLKLKPLLLGLFATLFETIANIGEHLFYTLFNLANNLTASAFLLLVAVAFLRSFFVVGIYSVITLQEQKRQLARILKIHTELYVEALYLKKSMEQIEALTSDSFQLYKTLKPLDSASSLEALRLSQEIHELKKDATRIYAGLSKIVQTDQAELYDVHKILQYVVLANDKYSEHLQKDITIHVHCRTTIQTHQQLALLAILNNLVSNAIEAIEHTGTITITVQQMTHTVIFTVTNDGPRIEEHLLPVIFEAGYTSKFNDHGFAATGIGLSHVQAIVRRLNGDITVSSNNETTFTVTIPIQHIS